MILSYPTSLPTLTISIRNPTLGDTDTLDTSAVIRTNRSGEPLSTRDSWPINETRSFSFSSLTRAKLNDLVNFLKVTAGLEIAILDHNNEVWFGYIISPVNEIVTVRDDCSYDMSFEFMGRKIS